MIKPENYIVIQGWMRTELDLSGTDLMMYAIIYGFSQTENQRFTGSLKYASEWLGCSKNTIVNSLKSLISKGLIVKVDKYINGVKFCEYYAENALLKAGQNFEGYTKNLDTGIQNSDIGYTKNLTGGIQKIRHNNKEINIKENTIYNPFLPTVEEIKKRVAEMKKKAEEEYDGL